MKSKDPRGVAINHGSIQRTHRGPTPRSIGDQAMHQRLQIVRSTPQYDIAVGQIDIGKALTIRGTDGAGRSAGTRCDSGERDGLQHVPCGTSMASLRSTRTYDDGR